MSNITVPLGRYTKIKTGKLDANASSVEGAYPFFTCSREPLRISSYSYDCECVLVAGNGDLNVKYYSGKFDAYQRTYIIESTDKQTLHTKYLYYFLDKYVEKLREQSIGGVIKYIKLGYLTEAQIPLPPLEVQRQIADVLDRANALIEKRKAQIDRLDLLVKSQFIEMFGDPVTNPKGWEQHKLQEYIEFLTSGSRGWSSYFSERGKMFLTIKNVKNSCLLLDSIQYICPPDTKETQRTKVQRNDLLISITADLGRTAVVSADVAEYGAHINQHLSLVRLDKTKTNPLYASYYLESQAGKRQFDVKNQVGVKSGLNFDAIKSLIISTPPMFLQNQFADFVQQVEAQKLLLQQSLSKLEQNYKSLMQKCFREEIFNE